MDYQIIIFWFICVSCGATLISTLVRHRSSAGGWVVVLLGILGVCLAGGFLNKPSLVYGAAAMWVFLVMLPGILSRYYMRFFLQQRYTSAYRVAKLIAWLHPADGCREQPEIVKALVMSQQGNLEAASEALRKFESSSTLTGLIAVANLYRLTGQWEELVAWQGLHSSELGKHPQLLSTLLRARGETGDLKGLIELYDRNKGLIAKLSPSSSRDICRLIFFAFCGKPKQVKTLVAGSLSIMPEVTQLFGWPRLSGRLATGKKQNVNWRYYYPWPMLRCGP
jgi:rhomboid protease GluP